MAGEEIPEVLPLLTGDRLALFATMLVLGGAVAAFYTLGLTLIGETGTARNADLVSLNTVFIMAYTAGMVVGPVASGGGMDRRHASPDAEGRLAAARIDAGADFAVRFVHPGGVLVPAAPDGVVCLKPDRAKRTRSTDKHKDVDEL